LAFVSDRHGNFDLWLQPLEDGKPEGLPRRLTDQPLSVATPAFSSDGRWLTYFRVAGDQRDIWVVPTDGGMPMQITDHPAADIHPVFSPDGRRIAFSSNRGGTQSIWVVNVEDGHATGEPWPLTGDDGDHIWPSWSPHGDRIAFIRVAKGESDAWVVDARPGAIPERITTGATALQAVWEPSGGRLLMHGAAGTDTSTIWLVDPETGPDSAPEPALKTVDEVAIGGFSVGAGGRLLAFTTESTKGDLWFMAPTESKRR
jgi:TolB protein